MSANIIKLYNDPKFGLIGIDKFMKKLQEKGYKYTRKEVEEALSELETFTLNKPARKSFPTRKVIVSGVFDQLQADLVFMDVPQGAPASENDGIKYLLTVIDVMSKYAWVVPLKTKSSADVTKAMEPIIETIRPNKLQVDKGSEFYNKTFNKMLDKYDVEMFSTNSDKKASIVERFNRTLKMRMSKLFDVNQNFRYIDELDDLVDNYNNTIHRTIKMKPIDAIEEENFSELYNNFYEKQDTPKQRNDIEIGDVVRIARFKDKFSKEIVGGWTIELFKIKKINKTSPITYNLIDLQDEDVEGIFYREELQKVSKKVLDDAFRIEKVLKTRTRKGKKESYIKWLGYPDKFNSWI